MINGDLFDGLTVLLIEPRLAEAYVVAALLTARRADVRHVTSGAQAEAALATQPPPDLIVMDVHLPDVDGLMLCATLKARLNVPVIVCTAADPKKEWVLSLRVGADDVMTKPVDPDECLARIEAALRRARRTPPPPLNLDNRDHTAADATAADATAANATAVADHAALPADRHQRIDGLEIDRLLAQVTLDGQEAHLTSTEYRLLSVLMSRPCEVFTREDLARIVCGYAYLDGSRSIDMHVRRLRRKLNARAEAAPALLTLRGRGYTLVPRRAPLARGKQTA